MSWLQPGAPSGGDRILFRDRSLIDRPHRQGYNLWSFFPPFFCLFLLVSPCFSLFLLVSACFSLFLTLCFLSKKRIAGAPAHCRRDKLKLEISPLGINSRGCKIDCTSSINSTSTYKRPPCLFSKFQQATQCRNYKKSSSKAVRSSVL